VLEVWDEAVVVVEEVGGQDREIQGGGCLTDETPY
jgi:hypothetical protein